MEAERASETSECNSNLTQVVFREYFIVSYVDTLLGFDAA
jgi:hypothetical protein